MTEVTEPTELKRPGDLPQATPRATAGSKPHPMRTAAPTCALRSSRRSSRRSSLRSSRQAALGYLLAAGLAGGCTASGEDVQPFRDQLAFPTGMAVSPDDQFLFVVNANSELRYDSGSIGVIELAKVKAAIDNHPSDCDPDGDRPEAAQCDEAQFIDRDAGVRVGNFATDLSIQVFSPNASTNLRLFVPTRGDPSVAWADFDGAALHCAPGSDSFALCDDAHRLTSLNNNPDLGPLPNEPFGVFASAVPAGAGKGNPTQGFAMVSHLGTGAVTLIDAPADSSQVQIVDEISGVFASDPSGTGARGATSVAGRSLTAVPAPPDPPAPGEGVPNLVPEAVYVASNTDNRIQTFTVGMRDGAAEYLLPGTFFVLSGVGTVSGSSIDTRSIQFSPSGDRLYIVNRSPPSLQVYDTSIGTTGTPRNELLGSSDLCRAGSTAAVFGDGADERVYVSCFQDGQLYVVNPFGQSQVEDIISVGRGPYAVVRAPTRKLLFVSNFLEDTIAVIDIDKDSPTHNRVVLRIGKPRAP